MTILLWSKLAWVAILGSGLGVAFATGALAGCFFMHACHRFWRNLRLMGVASWYLGAVSADALHVAMQA